MIIHLLLFTFSLLPNSHSDALAHEFHLSKCQIDYNSEEQALQISMHLFIDDLELALKQGGKDKLYICTEKENDKAETYIEDYLAANFKLKVDGQPVQYTFIGKEASEDLQGVWCYLEVTGIKSINRLNVSDKVLMEAFDDQKNIVSIKGPGSKQVYFLFMKGKSEEEVTF